MPDALVAAPVVVIVNEARDSVPQRGHVILRVQVYILSLDGPPKALYPDIIQTPGPAVHTDLDFVGCAGLQPLFAGVLASLVRVDDFGRSVGLYGPLKDFNGIERIKRVVKPPAHYTAAVYVNDCIQVHKAMFHSNIGNISTPHVVRMGDVQLPQQVRHPVFDPAALAQALLRIDGFDVHQRHQPADELTAYLEAHLL